ncbi:hypothetical protein M0805_004132 [Coniferiporia weirii]|nr:hypothetical protein M0805_004132 [Coniferiporia weirii]
MSVSRATTPFIPPMPGISPGGSPNPGSRVIPPNPYPPGTPWTGGYNPGPYGHRTPYSRPEGVLPPFDQASHFGRPANGLGLVDDQWPADYSRSPPSRDRDGFPDDYRGPRTHTDNYAAFQPIPVPSAFAGQLPPGTPWYPAPPVSMSTGYSTFQQPLPGMMPYGGFGAHPAAMAYPPGPPIVGYAPQPAMEYAYPRSAHSTPWHGGGYLPETPGRTAEPLPDQRRGAERPELRWGGVDTRWMIGTAYSPVLDPLLVSVVGCKPKVNPLIGSPPDDPKKRDYLTWNMLYPSSYVHRSNEPENQSWMGGRDAPATFPRLNSLRIISRQFTWFIDVRARNPEVGVTCGDVIDTVSAFLMKTAPQKEFEACSRADQVGIGAAYHHNRSMSSGVPGGALGSGLRRCDFLRESTTFYGIEADQEYVRTRMSLNHSQRDMPCIFVLNCERSLPRTEDELRAEGMRGSRPSSRGE